MADYKEINEKSLIDAIVNCANKVDKEVPFKIQEELKSLNLKGTIVKDNLLKAVSELQTKTLKLNDSLQQNLQVANEMKKYKEIKDTLDEVKRKKELYKSKYDMQQDETTSESQSIFSKYDYYKNQELEIENHLNIIKEKLIAAGYPSV